MDNPGRSILAVASIALAAAIPATRVGGESFLRENGEVVQGRVEGNAAGGFRFAPKAGGASIPLETLKTISFDEATRTTTRNIPPFQLLLGEGRRVSGRLRSITDTAIRLDDGPDGGSITASRLGAEGVARRKGEAAAFEESFDGIDPARWTSNGEFRVESDAKSSSLVIQPSAGSMLAKIDPPVASGRLEIRFDDEGAVASGRNWYVELGFSGREETTRARIVPGWSEDGVYLRTLGKPGLAVQRLPRTPGPHRLVFQFDEERAEVSIDSKILASGKGLQGSLSEIKIGAEDESKFDKTKKPAARIDEIRLTKFAKNPIPREVDPSQDDVTMLEGDQLFGRLRGADDRKVEFLLDGRPESLAWPDITSLYFRRVAGQSRTVQGLHVRLRWRVSPDIEPAESDMLDGALSSLTDEYATLETAYCGTIRVRREDLRLLEVLGRFTRIVIDAHARHLGDELYAPPEELDPPQPEGGTLEREFMLEPIPAGKAFLALDVLQVVGESKELQFSGLIRDGDLRTNVYVNDRYVDYLNRYVMTRNETPESIRVPIPAGVLKTGKNILRFKQLGTKKDPNYLDDLGVLNTSIVFEAPSSTNGP